MLRRRPSPRPATPPALGGAPTPKATAAAAAPVAPRPPAGARNLMIVVLDSLRHDSWLAADTPNLDRLGPVERRWSYASWTAPSHYNLLSGLLPHREPAPRVRVRAVQGRLHALQRPARHRRHRVQAAAAGVVPADLSQVARVPHPRTGVDAGAQPAHRASTATSTPTS